MKAQLVVKTKDGITTFFDVEDVNEVEICNSSEFITVYINDIQRAMIKKDNVYSIFLMDKPKVI